MVLYILAVLAAALWIGVMVYNSKPRTVYLLARDGEDAVLQGIEPNPEVTLEVQNNMVCEQAKEGVIVLDIIGKLFIERRWVKLALMFKIKPNYEKYTGEVL